MAQAFPDGDQPDQPDQRADRKAAKRADRKAAKRADRKADQADQAGPDLIRETGFHPEPVTVRGPGLDPPELLERLRTVGMEKLVSDERRLTQPEAGLLALLTVFGDRPQDREHHQTLTARLEADPNRERLHRYHTSAG
jgi:hypothetical protein